MHPIEVLERYWNYTSFRPLQEDIITSVLERNDTFALLPTGGGKSICYQIPALINDGICVVISPLIALMKDQVRVLKAKGIKAIALTSGLSYKDLDTQLDNCIYGNYKFLYLSPERLQQNLVLERLQQMKVNLIAVDEAHCISQWGNDFRPAYKQIITLRQLHPTVPCIAVTATAKQQVVTDIITHLDFVKPKLFKASFQRKNIVYHVLTTNDKQFRLQQLLSTYKGSAIVYVRTRRAAIDVSHYLEGKGFLVTFFHGGLTVNQKQERLQQWLNEQKLIMVATTAFGMGIDKPNVQAIIHYNLPESLESYYQEAGRAGRNGNEAQAIILKQTVDEEKLKAQFLGVLPSVSFVKKVYKKLSNYFQIAYGEGLNTTHYFNFKAFCKTYDFKPLLTYNALQILDRNSVIALNQQFNFKTLIQVLVSNNQLFQYLENNLEVATLTKVILRTYGGIFNYETKVNLSLITTKTEMPDTKIISQLQQLEKDGIISLTLANSDTEITFLKPREDDKTINPLAKIIEQQHLLKHQQVNAVIAYANNNDVCKNKQLLQYFNEVVSENCNKCSVCLSKVKIDTETDISTKILTLLKGKDLSSRQIISELNCNENLLFQHLKTLVETQQIQVTNHNTYTLK